MMNRRELITALMGFLGTGAVSTIYGAETFLSQREINKTVSLKLSLRQLHLLDEIGETIIPTTPGSPGAKAAKIGEFIQTMVNQYYLDSEQKLFELGLPNFDNISEQHYGKQFLDLTSEQKHDLLIGMDKNPDATYYKMVKQLTVWGYFSSEVGATTARQLVSTPGRFDPCITIKPGHKVMA